MIGEAPALLRDERILLDECIKVGPTGIGVLNRGHANFATTYSDYFCELVADLLLLYRKHGIKNTSSRLSEKFRAHKIKSCRGAEMNIDRVEYMLDNSVALLANSNTYRVLDGIRKSKCPICGRWKSGLEQHIQDAHQ